MPRSQSRQAHLQLVGPLRRAASADRAVHEGGRHQDEASADQWRRPGPDRDPRQQFAGAGVVDRRGERPDQGRQAARARLLQPETCGIAAGRADAEGARLRRRVLAVGRRVRAEGHAGADRQDAAAMPSSRRRPAISSRPRSTISATRSPISTLPRSRNSGTKTPSGSRRRCMPSAAFRADAGSDSSLRKIPEEYDGSP